MSDPKTCFHCGLDFSINDYITHITRVVTALGGGSSETLRYLVSEAEREAEKELVEEPDGATVTQEP